MVLFLYIGQLPWHHGAQQLSGRERLDYVIKMKQDLHITDYGDDIPCKFTKETRHALDTSNLIHRSVTVLDNLHYFIFLNDVPE